MLPTSAAKRGNSGEDDGCLSRLGTLICRWHHCHDPKDHKQERIMETASGFRCELTVQGFAKDSDAFVGFGRSKIEARRSATRLFDHPDVQRCWSELDMSSGHEKELKKQRCG
ncbi:unnamed protein product [Symbiodinium sp. CCMP2592]|nr:unnamed protein product [Symbiodinium sp. CCMP2592]